MSHSTPGMASGSQVSTVQSRTQGSAGVSAEPLGQSIMLAWPHLTGLIAVSILLFALGYVLFQRQEVRA